MKFNKCMIMFLIGTFLVNQFAFAGRIGSGRSRGMQRSMPSYQSNRNYSNNNYSGYNRNNQIPPTNNQINQQPQKKGMSAGSAALLGAAAGAAGGYLLGKSSVGDNLQNNQNITPSTANTLESINQNNIPNNANTINDSNKNLVDNTASQIPWGIIFILVVVLLIGIAFFRKKSSIPNNYKEQDYGFNVNNHNISNSNSSTNYQQTSASTSFANININELQKLADGSEKEFFLRQAKGMFLHIQSMNNRDNITEIAKYFTPELYESIKDDIANNQSIADFTNLDCQLVDSVIEHNTLIASVKFSGMVSDNPNQPPVPFIETWHFIKSDMSINKWLVAGIQQ